MRILFFLIIGIGLLTVELSCKSKRIDQSRDLIQKFDVNDQFLTVNFVYTSPSFDADKKYFNTNDSITSAIITEELVEGIFDGNWLEVNVYKDKEKTYFIPDFFFTTYNFNDLDIGKLSRTSQYDSLLKNRKMHSKRQMLFANKQISEIYHLIKLYYQDDNKVFPLLIDNEISNVDIFSLVYQMKENQVEYLKLTWNHKEDNLTIEFKKNVDGVQVIAIIDKHY